MMINTNMDTKIIERWHDEYWMLYESWINNKYPELCTNNWENLDMEEEFEEDYIESVTDQIIEFTD